MQKPYLDLKILIILCLSFFSESISAQLGFCQGNSGDPIFVETFGTGLQQSPLPPGTTSYTYANGQPPDDGFYTVSSNTNYFDWLNVSDVTPGDVDGRMLIVNSDASAGEFFRTDITGLCENTTYEFSSWLINLAPSNGFCGAGAIPINVRFEIWDNTDTNILASGTTGNISGTLTPNWEQYALVFQTIPGQTSVILKMINNSSGGCGNDLAIDDIIFKSCGDLIAIEDSSGSDQESICSSQTPFSETITAVPDFEVFSNHFYQWQISTDGLNWQDVAGETNSSITVSGVTATTYYRAKVAEFQANLSNSDCITLSDVYQITVNQAPPPPTIACWETATFNDSTCSWTVTGSQPAAPTDLECWEMATFNNTTCIWDVTGSQPTEPAIECWETATFNTSTCSWDITGTQPAQPTLECWETATFNNMTCVWEVSGTQPVQPTLECWETATFNNTSCLWEVTGTQPDAPTGLECWEVAIYNDTICDWEVTGTQPVQPTTECWETATFNNTTCIWEVTGTQPEAPIGLECWELATFNDAICSWEISGTQAPEPTDLECWQSTVFNETICDWEITGTQPIEFRDEFLNLCENETIILDPYTTIINTSYQWVSGELSPTISVDSEGTYQVEITDGCVTEQVTFYVTLIENPIIESVISDGSAIVINLLNQGNYEYSLDGMDYQYSNTFGNTPSGSYTVYVKSNLCETVVTAEHFHFFIQKYMTPNFDGRNDTFSINVSQFFTRSEVYIFNRYGKLLYSASNSDVNWDGTFIGNELPTSDYWYLIILDGKEYRGHFTLKR
ncbi:T9SS type B sorting domain-containing protein [Winogradskyella sp.]|uniref:T9SS type B sorting domain-containing protein n=1 Tax=Winogradskyella sp. TaxID=1883156 RepID=UPI003F6D4ADA